MTLFASPESQKLDPGGFMGRFGSKKHVFWCPFWHRFFNIFQKWRKCVISEEYNVFRGSGPWKSDPILIQNMLNSRIWFKHLPGDNFGRARVAIQPKGVIVVPPWIFVQSNIEFWIDLFRPKGSKIFVFFLQESSRSRPWRDLAPKRPRSHIVSRFGTDVVPIFGWILIQLSMDWWCYRRRCNIIS